MLSEVNVSLYLKKSNSKLNIAVNVLIVLTIIVLILEVFFTISYSGIYVIQQSMNDTLIGAEEHPEGEAYYLGGKLVRDYFADTQGDYVYVNKNAKPDYKNIVVVKKNDDTTIIKRVIAKGGDYVKIAEGKVYRKHSAEEEFEPIIEDDYVTPENNDPMDPYNSFHNDDVGFYVEEGHYFLLGDNRNVSIDSRENGGTCYTDEQIYGVVTGWSLNGKSFFTKLHKFFAFDLPGFFGIDNRVKRTRPVS